MYYIYILHSESSHIYYVGYTNDWRQRVKTHNETDRITFTSKHRPWTLKAVFEAGDNEAIAIQIERFIKAQKSKKLIEKMIAGDALTGILAQLVRVPDVRD